MRYRFVTVDVFTESRFGGNPLSVIPDARGLDPLRMQQVAREFNHSETTFVLPSENGHDRRVRIFTPAREVPFAGHPNIGTAFVLAVMGQLGPADVARTIVFEEAAGLVAVAIRPLGEGRLWCELTAPERLSVGPEIPPEVAAAALGLTVADVSTGRHRPVVASVGLPFVLVELADLDALASAEPDLGVIAHKVAPLAGIHNIHAYVQPPGGLGDGIDLRARMFAPLEGIPEDPATGSANCALAGLLASLADSEGQHGWRIAQGVEMGRPSLLQARAERRGGAVTGVWIGGESVLVSEGVIEA